VRREVREGIADWLIVVGAVGLVISLFLVWSHQFSREFLTRVGAAALQGIPRDPTAWQVYSIADVLLAVLAASLILAALIAGRRARISALVAAGLGLVFVLHAISVAPTNGANVSDPGAGPGRFLASSATSGAGEVVAAVALGVAIVGLALSFTAD
jgi:hypothetical protein